MAKVQLFCGDCVEVMREMESESIDLVVTSPPYWGLRDYGHDGQLGLEEKPQEYVANMITVFAEVHRILKKEGTLWLNLGDSYGSGNRKTHADDPKYKQRHEASGVQRGKQGYEKQLIGIPNLVAHSIRDGFFYCDVCCAEVIVYMNRLQNGKLVCPYCETIHPADIDVFKSWYLRQDIIWYKPNAMPESVMDRCTKSYEYIFLLSKSKRYFFNSDAIKEDSIDDESYTGRRKRNAPTMAKFDRDHLKNAGSILDDGTLKSGMIYEKRNKRSVWIVTTKPFKGSHFATFPEDLIAPCILAGSKEGDTVLDPFAGSGTTLKVSQQLGRNAIGIEISPQYCDLIRQRLAESEDLLTMLQKPDALKCENLNLFNGDRG